MFGDIDLNERERDGDAVIFDLFREWQVQMRIAESGDNEDLAEKAMDDLTALEDRLCDAVPSGAPGLAIKIFLHAHMARGARKTMNAGSLHLRKRNTAPRGAGFIKRTNVCEGC